MAKNTPSLESPSAAENLPSEELSGNGFGRVLSAEERRRLDDLNPPPVPFPREATVGDLFSEQAARSPDSVALITTGRQLTYSELNEAADQLAQLLIAKGAVPDCAIALAARRTETLIIGVLAILKAGAAYLPLELRYPRQRLAFLLEDSQAALVLTEAACLSLLPEFSGPQTILFEEDGASRPPIGKVLGRAKSHHLAYVLYTSGSTGRPKGVQVEHHTVVNLFAGLDRLLGVAPEARWLAASSLSFDVSVLEILRPLCRGQTVILLGDADSGDTIPHLIARYGATHFQCTPSQASVLLLDPEAPAALRRLRQFLLAGEAVSADLVARLRRTTDAEIYNLYGPTETTYAAGIRVTDDTDPIPIGRPLANVRFYVVDQELNLLPPGASGELLIAGESVARGYCRLPELSAERFIPDRFGPIPGGRLYRTGDRGRWSPAGNLEFLGRMDSQVKFRGYRIEPGEIEHALMSHAAIRQAVVLVRKVDDEDSRLAAYFTWNDTARAGVEEIRAHLRRTLPEFMVPGAFVALDTIPLTVNGKVDCAALPRDAPELSEDGQTSQPPVGGLECQVAEVWRQILGLAQLPGRHTRFFDLGGASLVALRVVQRLRMDLGYEVPIRAVFNHPTVAELARFLATLPRTNPPPPDAEAGHVAAPADWAPLSDVQRRIWFHERYAPGLPIYNIPLQIRLNGPLELAALEAALTTIVRRHAVLRTALALMELEAFQRTQPPQRVVVHLTDFRHLTTADRTAALRREVKAEAQKLFNLTESPFLRARLFRLAETEHVLVVTLHHLAADGWSLGVLWSELEVLYTAFKEGRPDPLPPLPLPYSEFTYVRGQKPPHLEADLAYWRQRLEGSPPQSDLPGDRRVEAAESFAGGRVAHTLPRELARALERAACERKVTLFMFLLASFQALLHRLSGQTDFIVGSPVARRSRPESAGMIGCFVNLIALRSHAEGDPTFAELLERTRETVLAGLEHQELPFDRLVEGLQLGRQPGRHPLFQIVFNYQDVPLPRREFGGLEAEAEEIGTDCVLFDLMLIVTPQTADGGIEAVMEYSTARYAPDTVRRLLDSWSVLLRAAVEQPETRLSRLQLLGQAERELLLGDWAGIRTPFPRDRLVHELFGEQVRRQPASIALAAGETTLTYAELDERSGRLANFLRERGVASGTPVAVCVARSPELIVTLLAVLKAGGGYVPIDMEYPAERIRLLLADSAAPVLVRLGNVQGLAQFSGLVVDLALDASEISRFPAEVPESDVRAEGVAAIFYTSGSTGRPKGVCIPHRAMVRLVRDTNYATFTRRDVFLQLAPVSFDASTLEIWGALLSGARLVVPPPGALALSEIGALIVKHQVSVLWLTAGLFRLMVDEQIEALCRVRHVLAGGDVLSPGHVRRLLEAGCPQVTNGYGPTENGTFTTCHGMTWPPSADEPIPLGRPVANTEVYVLDDFLQPVPVGVEGELFAGGDGLATGYWRQPELTAEKFLPHPFRLGTSERLYRTGDLVRWRTDATLEFLGRRDRQLKLRGFRVEPEEIERVLLQHPGICEAVVVVHAATEGEKVLTAYWQKHPEAAFTEGELRGFLRERLPDYMVPARLVALARLPLTPNGKVDRAALSRERMVVDSRKAEAVETESMVEALLCEIWQRLLGVEQIGRDQNFFELGGHSLLTLQLLEQIRRVLGVELPLRLLFTDPTIGGLLRNVIEHGMRTAEGVSATPRPPMVKVQSKGDRSPIFVFPGGYGNESELISTAWLSHRYLGQDQPIYALTNRAWRGAGPLGPNLASLAEDAVTEMRRVQPHGPWFLAGLCVGGNLAFEVARQLQQAGEAVPLLILSDCERPRPGEYYRFCVADPFRGKRQFLMNSLFLAFPRLRTLLNSAGRRHLIATALGQADDSQKAAKLAALRATEREWRFYQEGEGYLRRLMVPPKGRFQGRIDLVLSDELKSDARSLAWRENASQGAEVLHLPGNHATYLIKGASRLADFYRRRIDAHLARHPG